MKKPESQRFIDKYFWHGVVAVVGVGALANLYVWFGPRATQTLEPPFYPVVSARACGLRAEKLRSYPPPLCL